MGRKQSSSFWHSRRRSASAPATPRAAADPPLGCMSMVNYLIFAPGGGCVGRPPTSNAAVVAPRDNYHRDDVGIRWRDVENKENKAEFEAPRNSLDLNADNLNDIQIGVQIEPVFDALACRKMRAKATAPSSEAETPRTPSLVARLMGIDGLPDNQSPSPAQLKKPTRASAHKKEKENSPASKEKKKRVIPESMNREPLRSLSCNVSAAEARSLPDTPRASTSARASWDGERLSLQALKKNVLDRAAQYMSLPTSPTSDGKKKKKKKKNTQDVNGRRVRREERERTANEIVRQAKETVASRKLAKGQQKQSSDNKENVSPVPVRKDKLLAVVQADKQTVVPSPPTKAQSTERQLAPTVALAPKHQPPQHAKPSRPPLDTLSRAKKPDGCERFATRIKKPAPPPASPAAPPRNQTAARSSPSRHAVASLASRPAVPLEEDPEYSYLRTVLESGGFVRSSPPSRIRPFKGHSVASPVDPIVFHLLEPELPADEARLGPLRHRWNWKLIFHLPQEILADLLLGLDASSTSVPGVAGRTIELPRGAALLARVWKTVRGFPAADCRVVGDIDALVAADLESASVQRLERHPAVVEEAGDVAKEVAERVLEALLGECVAEESLSLSSYCNR